MTRYFFHLHECGLVTEDDEGAEFTNLADARTAAVREARSLMSHEVLDGRLCLSCHITIADADNVELLRVPFRQALTVSGI